MTTIREGHNASVDTAMAAGSTGPTNPALLRLGAVCSLVGFAAQVPLGLWHPHQVQPNDSVGAFHEYAHSQDWTLVHLGQYAGALLVAVGLVTVAVSLMHGRGLSGALAVVGAVTAVVATAVFAVQMAVDGIALKSAVDTWESTQQPSAFQVADAVRATEKGLSALFHLNNAVTLLALGTSVAVGHGYPRWLGWVGAAAGATVAALAVLTAKTGFSQQAGTVGLFATVLVAVFLLGTAVVMWRAASNGPYPRSRRRETTGPESL